MDENLREAVSQMVRASARRSVFFRQMWRISSAKSVERAAEIKHLRNEVEIERARADQAHRAADGYYADLMAARARNDQADADVMAGALRERARADEYHTELEELRDVRDRALMVHAEQYAEINRLRRDLDGMTKLVATSVVAEEQLRRDPTQVIALGQARELIRSLDEKVDAADARAAAMLTALDEALSSAGWLTQTAIDTVLAKVKAAGAGVKP